MRTGMISRRVPCTITWTPRTRYPAEVESYLRIDLPPAEYAQLLDNPPDKKVFAVTYLAYDRQGLMIEYTLSYHLPQYTSFTYVTERKF